MNRALTTTTVILSLTWPITQGVAADADAGKVAYEKNCAGCHGADGKGNPAVAKIAREIIAIEMRTPKLLSAFQSISFFP